ncbi:maturase [Canna indica]|uniref:Maturase n=1 Tax=Canna indica TaxID=4628 RepID=A0AAQ3JPG6_9LILI|nr:maturase [Canna indica]
MASGDFLILSFPPLRKSSHRLPKKKEFDRTAKPPFQDPKLAKVVISFTPSKKPEKISNKKQGPAGIDEDTGNSCLIHLPPEIQRPACYGGDPPTSCPPWWSWSWSWDIRGYHRLLSFIFTLRCFNNFIALSFAGSWEDSDFFPFYVEGRGRNCIFNTSTASSTSLKGLHLSSNRRFREKRILGSHEEIDDPKFFYGTQKHAGRLVGGEKGPYSIPHSVLLSALPGNIYLHKLDQEIGRIRQKHEIPLVLRIRSVLLWTGCRIDDQEKYGEEASFNAPQDNRAIIVVRGPRFSYPDQTADEGDERKRSEQRAIGRSTSSLMIGHECPEVFIVFSRGSEGGGGRRGTLGGIFQQRIPHTDKGAYQKDSPKASGSRCCDNLYQVRTIVDHQIRWSAIFTPAHKHKSSARNIIPKYPKDSNIVNQEGGKTLAKFPNSIELGKLGPGQDPNNDGALHYMFKKSFSCE